MYIPKLKTISIIIPEVEDRACQTRGHISSLTYLVLIKCTGGFPSQNVKSIVVIANRKNNNRIFVPTCVSSNPSTLSFSKLQGMQMMLQYLWGNAEVQITRANGRATAVDSFGQLAAGSRGGLIKCFI